jgi:hypothetical protein
MERHGRGAAGFEAMADAYLRFAVAHPSHYRVMFGRSVEPGTRDPELVEEAEAAFQALVELQRDGRARGEDPLMQARFIWSVTHGIATLLIDGWLRDSDESGEASNRYAAERIRAAIAPEPYAGPEGTLALTTHPRAEGGCSAPTGRTASSLRAEGLDGIDASDAARGKVTGHARDHGQ